MHIEPFKRSTGLGWFRVISTIILLLFYSTKEPKNIVCFAMWPLVTYSNEIVFTMAFYLTNRTVLRHVYV